jgi:hypothetical protein
MDCPGSETELSCRDCTWGSFGSWLVSLLRFRLLSIYRVIWVGGIRDYDLLNSGDVYRCDALN